MRTEIRTRTILLTLSDNGEKRGSLLVILGLEDRDAITHHDGGKHTTDSIRMDRTLRVNVLVTFDEKDGTLITLPQLLDLGKKPAIDDRIDKVLDSLELDTDTVRKDIITALQRDKIELYVHVMQFLDHIRGLLTEISEYLQLDLRREPLLQSILLFLAGETAERLLKTLKLTHHTPLLTMGRPTITLITGTRSHKDKHTTLVLTTSTATTLDGTDTRRDRLIEHHHVNPRDIDTLLCDRGSDETVESAITEITEHGLLLLLREPGTVLLHLTDKDTRRDTSLRESLMDTLGRLTVLGEDDDLHIRLLRDLILDYLKKLRDLRMLNTPLMKGAGDGISRLEIDVPGKVLDSLDMRGRGLRIDILKITDQLGDALGLKELDSMLSLHRLGEKRDRTEKIHGLVTTGDLRMEKTLELEDGRLAETELPLIKETEIINLLKLGIIAFLQIVLHLPELIRKRDLDPIDIDILDIRLHVRIIIITELDILDTEIDTHLTDLLDLRTRRGSEGKRPRITGLCIILLGDEGISIITHSTMGLIKDDKRDVLKRYLTGDDIILKTLRGGKDQLSSLPELSTLVRTDITGEQGKLRLVYVKMFPESLKMLLNKRTGRSKEKDLGIRQGAETLGGKHESDDSLAKTSRKDNKSIRIKTGIEDCLLVKPWCDVFEHFLVCV